MIHIRFRYSKNVLQKYAKKLNQQNFFVLFSFFSCSLRLSADGSGLCFVRFKLLPNCIIGAYARESATKYVAASKKKVYLCRNFAQQTETNKQQP